MGGEPMVSYLTGSMNSLIGKLTKLKNRPVILEELLQDLLILKEGFFDKLALSGRRETDAQVRAWMKQVRELVFDIEDWVWVDEKPEVIMGDPSRREEIEFFKTQIQEARERCTRYDLLRGEVPTSLDPPDDVLGSTEDHFSKVTEYLRRDLESLKRDLVKLKGRRQEIYWQVREWDLQAWELVNTVIEWIDHNPANDMGRKITQHFRSQIQRQRERCKMYLETPHAILPVPISAFTFSHNWKEETGDVDRPISKLVEHLADEQETFLKVVSIVGKEGLGKTTLAKEAYAKLGGKFECRAFVTIGQSPSLKAILMDIFRQVKPQDTIPEDWTGSPDVQQVITKLQKHLGTMRYFILIDDIRSTYAWKVISCALPDKNHGSRVLTTTCNVEVANTCSMRPIDVVEEMWALGEGESRALFYREVKMPVSNEILKMCSGMPLAIIITAGLLSKSPVEPKILQKYILSTLEQYSTSEEMRNILHFSYADLAAPVKSCFLYLSIFPEYHTIKKDHLIRLWVAEGFISRRYKERRDEEIVDEGGRCEEGMWERGERYFNELISRRLIQPVFSYEDDQAVGCTVHGVILDFIRSMSSKENFVTVGANLGSGPLPCITDTIRRFSLDCCGNEDDADSLASRTLCLSSMRSLAVFGDTEWTPLPTDFEDSEGKPVLENTEVISVLPSFTFLRVLYLEDTGNLRSHHLKGIGGLILLRYMRLGGTGIHGLPEEIGKLEHLEMLDVRRTNLKTLPASIVGLKRLMSLLIDGSVELPSDIFVMQGLEEVSTIGVSSSRSLESVVVLLRLTQRLRVLGLSLARLDQSCDYTKVIISFLMEVARSNLVSLSLHCLHGALHRQLPTLYQNQLRRFELTISGPNLRRDIPWIVPTHLEIEICDLEEETLSLLGMASHLVLLKLVSSGRRKKRRIINTGSCLPEAAFPCLQVFWFTCKDGGTQLVFVPGFMPQLQRLRLDFKAREMRTLCRSYSFGINCLPGLVRVHSTIDCEGATVSEVEAVEAQIRSEANRGAHVEFSREHEHKMLKAEGNRKRIGPLKKIKNLLPSSVPRKKKS